MFLLSPNSSLYDTPIELGERGSKLIQEENIDNKISKKHKVQREIKYATLWIWQGHQIRYFQQSFQRPCHLCGSSRQRFHDIPKIIINKKSKYNKLNLFIKAPVCQWVSEWVCLDVA